MSADERTLAERVRYEIGLVQSTPINQLSREVSTLARLLSERQAEIERLETGARIDTQYKSQMCKDLEKYAGEIDSLRRDLEAARVDAERYRCIANCIGQYGYELRRYTTGKAKRMWKFARPFDDECHLHPTLDAAIDAARARGEENADD